MGAEANIQNDEDVSIAAWRIVLLFLLILLIDTCWDVADRWVTHCIRQRPAKHLVHAWGQLKFEILVLGLISLLLVAFEVRRTLWPRLAPFRVSLLGTTTVYAHCDRP
jgi:hypothetical protein